MFAEYKSLIKGTDEEELYKTYGILLSDLKVDDTVERYFDGSIPYIHIKSGEKYTYYSIEHYWE